MIKPQEIYKLCENCEEKTRPAGIRYLVSHGYCLSTATKYYNIWRRHYLESSSEELMISGVYIQNGKLLEQCTYKERQKYLKTLSKEQLIIVTQALLK